MKILVGLAAVMLVACGGDDTVSKTVEQLQDPSTCMECHPQHVQQWQASMHAYASVDPVFVAMNKRGQRETNNSLGTFCVKCHAPMAVELAITDGTNFDPTKLTPATQGVTCYFCHNVASIASTHNNNTLTLAHDQTMRGGVSDPVKSSAHRSSYDPLMDSTTNKSEMCGSCHDVVTPRGVELERTFKEWNTTFFAEDDPLHHLTCGSCHMPSSTGTIADAPGVKSRNAGFHEHLWPAIDQALTTFPGTDTMAAGIKRDLDGAIAVIGPSPLTSPVQPGGICLDPQGKLTVRVDSIGTGHDWPSGAAQDRRAWLEVVAYDNEDKTKAAIVFTSGTNADGTSPAGDPEDLADPTLFGLWDRTKKDDGTPAHFFWDVATVDSQLLRPPVTLDKNSPLFDHSSTATFNLPSLGVDASTVKRIETRIRIRPLSYAMIDDLIASGDLDASIRAQLDAKTLDILGSQSTWLNSTKGTGPALGTACNPQ